LSKDVRVVLKQAELSRGCVPSVNFLTAKVAPRWHLATRIAVGAVAGAVAVAVAVVLLILCEHVLGLKTEEHPTVSLVWHTSSLNETRVPLP